MQVRISYNPDLVELTVVLYCVWFAEINARRRCEALSVPRMDANGLLDQLFLTPHTPRRVSSVSTCVYYGVVGDNQTLLRGTLPPITLYRAKEVSFL
jgi:hypothetical protein